MIDSIHQPSPAWTRNDHEHAVRLYEHDAFLVDAVAGFIAAAMLRREAGIILATPVHQAAIEARLQAAGLDLDLLQRTEQLVIRDAQTLLGEFMLDGLPDPSRFRATVGALVAKATREETRRVRVFGELVDLLAADGNMAGALRLEELWSDLQLSQPFALFCGYPMHRFAGISGGLAFEGVRERHERVFPTEGYSTLDAPDEQLRTIAMLQRQALALTAEVQARCRSDERLRRQFLANPLPTFVWERTPGVGPDGSDDYLLVEQNEAAERFLEAVGGPGGADSVGLKLSGIDPESAMGALPDLLACADPDRRVWREHSFAAQETGRRRYIQMSLVVMPPDLAIVFVEDVTERLEADERKVQQARSEKLRALGQLASGVAHDLNQHLTMIAGNGELIRDALKREAVSPEVQEALDAILKAALDSGETVNQLLRFGRHQPDGVHAPVDVTGLLQEVARLTAPRWRDLAQLEGRPIRLDVLVMGADLEVLGHAPSLREALTNLVFNAVDALPYGGEIHLSAERAGDQVVLSVSDTGTGMSPEVQARVFEPYFSTGGERSSGLGLAHVWSTMERHGGTLDVQTSKQTGDTGTTIRLTLPAAASSRTVPRRQIPTGTGPRLRLLVVDDEPALAQLAAQGLRRAGHQVVAQHSATEALETLSAEAFDVLVTDLGLGEGMNGWELVTQARKLRPGLRVVMVSGWASDIDPALAAANGVDAVVAKPYQLAALIQAVEGQTDGMVGDSDDDAGASRPAPAASKVSLSRGTSASPVSSTGWAPRRSIGA
jgi:signal transduction histidine kinase/ActR/RegA family two-component response regulator